MFACSTEIMRNHGLKNIKDIMVIMRDVYIYIYIPGTPCVQKKRRLAKLQ